MKNKLIALGALSAVSVSSLAAQDELSVTGSLAYEGAYMFRGMKFAEATYFPSVDVAYGNFYAGLWAALPLDTDEANEVDLYAGYGFDLSELVSLDVGATYYTFPSTVDGVFESGNTLEFYTGFAFDVAFSPAVYVYYDVDLDVLTLEGSAGYSWEVAENITFDVSAALGYVMPDEGDEYTYAVGTAGFGFSLTEAASASVFASYSIASEDYGTGGGEWGNEDNEIWFGASITTGF